MSQSLRILHFEIRYVSWQTSRYAASRSKNLRVKISDVNGTKIIWAGNCQKLPSKMKVVSDYFQKMQQVPGNSQLTICKHGITRKWLHFQNVTISCQFQFIYSELEIVRNWCLFQILAKKQQKKPKSDSWQFLAHI